MDIEARWYLLQLELSTHSEPISVHSHVQEDEMVVNHSVCANHIPFRGYLSSFSSQSQLCTQDLTTPRVVELATRVTIGERIILA
jgi:hypothetical protein